MRGIHKIETHCKTCGKTMLVWKCELDWGRGKHCSVACKNKTKQKEKKCLICNKIFSIYPYRQKTAKYCSVTCQIKSGCMTKALKGKPMGNTQKRRIGRAAKLRVKMGKHNWGNGKRTKIRRRIYNSIRYKIWRSSVFKRDGYICQECGKKDVYLQAHHIKQFNLYPKLRFLINNGLTLCIGCHRKTDTWGLKGKLRPKESYLQGGDN